MQPTAFLPGLVLAERFYHEVVAPLLAEGFPGLAHSAGLIGPGSEVLGFDTPQSSDHHWGPRVMLFLAPENVALRLQLEEFLAQRLPPSFLGWSTHWGPPDEIGVRLLVPAVPGQPLAHRVEVDSPEHWFLNYLGIDPLGPLEPSDWLVPTEQKLRTIRCGRMFRDDLKVGAAQKALEWYPEPVWREKMAVLWQAIADEEPFVGRCGDVGDDRGSRLVAARLVEQALHLAFLQEKEFAPYSKWFGTAFERLAGAAELVPLVDAVLVAAGWRAREAAFNALGEALVRRHNALGLTAPLKAEASSFWGRPYKVIHGDRVAAALKSH